MPLIDPVADAGLGNHSYFVDLGEGAALVVDPARDPSRYVALAERRRARVRWSVDTHLHADFVSGSRELGALGARIAVPAAGGVAFGVLGLGDGDEIDLGGLTLEAIATPGHTPEHLAYLLRDGATPLALFSGGALLAGGVARPDLLGPEHTETLARAAYRTLHDRLLPLPDDLPVHPTHGASSFCSVSGGTGGSTTIGAERVGNPLLAGDPDEDTFVARLLGGLGAHPPYFLELGEVNRAGPQVHGPTPPPLRQLTVQQLEAAVADGAELVDVRRIEAFAGGHVPGALSNPWRAQFATWLGWLVPRTRPVVFVADETVDRRDLVWAALTVGFEQLAGELAGGMDAWAAAGRRVARTPLVDAAGSGGRHLLDVRQRAEYVSGHVPGAVNVELGTLAGSVEAVPDGPVLVHCGHGERAMSAASLLQRAGHRAVAVLAGGPEHLTGLAREDGQ